MSINSHKNQKAKYRNDFIKKIAHLIDPINSKGTAVYAFIETRKRRYHLDNIDSHETITEAVRRGIEYIDKNCKSIDKPEAWLRTVCNNILVDKVKENAKEEKIVEQYRHMLDASADTSAQEIFIHQLELAERALKDLSPSDQQIIRMRLHEGKTYEQIQHYYELQGEAITISTLRKRESRAIVRLKDKFFAIYVTE